MTVGAARVRSGQSLGQKVLRVAATDIQTWTRRPVLVRRWMLKRRCMVILL